MQNLLFRKIEMWVVGLLLVLGLAAIFVVSVAVRNAALGHDRFGPFGRAALFIAAMPSQARLAFRDPDMGMSIRGHDRFSGKSGWTFSDPAAQTLSGHLLVSRYDGDQKRHAIELLDLRTQEVLFSWWPDADTLFSDIPRTPAVEEMAETWNRTRFRVVHPVLFENGDLLIKNHGAPLMRIDACANLLWKTDQLTFHHAIEPGFDGTYWVPRNIPPSKIWDLDPDFIVNDGLLDEGIVNVSSDGEVLYEKSVAEVLIANGQHYLFDPGSLYNDRMHLNDIEPVLTDGPFWRAGDLFLSLRHMSLVLLFRPSTEKIIWMQQGPWASQHDVEILDDHRIAIFNNNLINLGTELHETRVVGTSGILVYDFNTDKTTNAFQPLFEDYQIKTETEGLFAILPGGGLFVEEENYGRLLFFSPEGEKAAEFVNRAENGEVYHLGWSRYLPPGSGTEAAIAALSKVNCT